MCITHHTYSSVNSIYSINSLQVFLVLVVLTVVHLYVFVEEETLIVSLYSEMLIINIAGELTSPADLLDKITAIGGALISFNLYETQLRYNKFCQ